MPTTRAIYVRGPNNVYVRRHDAPLVASTDSGRARQKEEVDGILTSIMESGFDRANKQATANNESAQKTPLLEWRVPERAGLFVLGASFALVAQHYKEPIGAFLLVFCRFLLLGLVWALVAFAACLYTNTLPPSIARFLPAKTQPATTEPAAEKTETDKTDAASAPSFDEHKEDIVNVRPFVAPVRKLARTKTEVETRRPREPRRHSLALVEMRSDKYKPLPPLSRPVDDLPLVHEVQLQGLGRLETVLSKNLVLGTRANYSRFLANVNDVRSVANDGVTG